MRFRINLLDDGAVVTGDGEYVGTWRTDESDAFFEFIPDGQSEMMFSHPFRYRLCEFIEEWHQGKQAA